MIHEESIKPVKTGVSGCGGITPTVFRGLEGFTELDIIAVQDINPDAAQRVADEFKVPRCHTNFSDLLSEDIELVIINTPNDCHRDQAVEAFADEKHCMVQKPIARNVSEGIEMIEAAKKADRLLGVVMLERSDPIYRQMRSMVQAGCFGTITVVRAALAHTNHLRKPPSPGNWRNSPEKIGGGSFIQLAIHHLDIAQFILDSEIKQVTALSASVIEPERFPKDETTGAVVRFKDGAIGQFVSSFTTTFDSIEIFGTDGMVRRNDERISWLVKELYSGEVWDSGRVGELHDYPMPVFANKVMETLALYEPHRMFAHAIRGKAPVETPGEAGLQALKVVEAVSKSAEENRSVTID